MSSVSRPAAHNLHPASEWSRILELWTRLLRGHAAMGRVLGVPLQVAHGLTVSQYATLLLLSQAERHQMRRVDVADGLQLTPSGVTRLLDSMQRSGLVEKSNAHHDGRVTYAVLTDAGERKLEQVSQSHVAAIWSLLRDRYSERELDTLIELLGRLASAETDGRSATKRGHPS